jgi:Tol biopolymer transport system component
LPLILVLSGVAAAREPDISVTMTEGTNMSAAVSPDGQTIIAAIQGTLWSIPGRGGVAKALTAPELDAQEPVFSQDGKWVAFYAFASDGWSVWTMAPDGTSLRQRSAPGPGDARFPSFSPDGRSLLFSSDSEGGYSAVGVDLASGKQTTLVAAAAVGYTAPTSAYFPASGNVVAPTLAPDNRSLAYIVDGQPDTLFVRPIAGGLARALYSADTLGAPAWSRDGTGLYLVALTSSEGRVMHVSVPDAHATPIGAAGDVFPFRPSVSRDTLTVTADGKIKAFPLAGGEPATIPFEATVTFSRPKYARRSYDFTDRSPHEALGVLDPALSPDGSQVVFTAVGDLWLADARTGSVAHLTDDEAIDLSPSWSPDGRQIAFVSDRDGKSDIWTITPDGRTSTRLTDLDAPANAPVWSPDGERIAFLKDSAASIFISGTVEVLDVKSKAVTRVMAEVFGPSSPSWSATGSTVAVVARKPMSSRYREGFNALLLAPAEGNGPQRWVSPAGNASLGRRQWNRPAWSARGEIAYRFNGALWVNTLNDAGTLGPGPRRIAESGENPSWSADGSKLVYLDGDRLMLWNADTGAARRLNAGVTWSRAIPESRYTIRVGRLFDGKGDAYRSNVDVVVNANLIEDIRASGTKPVEGRLIDAADRVMLPGLIEGHTHQSSSLGRSLGRRWLRYGITSVRETGADPYEAVERREAEAAGRRQGPRVFTAGPLNEGGRVSYGVSETVGTLEQAEAAVRRSTALKLDLLKSYVREDYSVQRGIIGAAHASGIPITGHELYPALANGADQMEHVGGTSRRGFSTKLSRLNVSYQDVVALVSKSGLVLTPTLALNSANGTHPIPQMQRTVKAIADQGGHILAGVDSPFVTFADSLHTELKHYVEGGIAPAKAIRFATSEAARALGAENQLGSVQPGKVADLILVEGDPLASISDLRRITWVMKNGEVVWQAGD